MYQLPAWCCAGLAVVFSPLISLIQDQVDAMLAIGIRAVYLSSTQDQGESRTLMQVINGRMDDCDQTSCRCVPRLTPLRPPLLSAYLGVGEHVWGL